MAFKHSFSFAADLAANFGCHQFRIKPEIISKLLHIAIWSGHLRWLLDFNLSGHPFLEQNQQVVDLDMLCTGFNFEHADLFLCPNCIQRPMNDWKIEQSNKCGFGRQTQMKIKSVVTTQNLQSINICLTLKPSQQTPLKIKSVVTAPLGGPGSFFTLCCLKVFPYFL